MKTILGSPNHLARQHPANNQTPENASPAAILFHRLHFLVHFVGMNTVVRVSLVSSARRS